MPEIPVTFSLNQRQVLARCSLFQPLHASTPQIFGKPMINKQNMKHSLLATLLMTSFTGFVHAADPIQLEPLSDPEITANAESGAACWAAIKGKTYLYDDGGKGLVKVNGKIIKLKSLAKEGSFGTGPYSSSDGGIKIAVLKNGNLEIEGNGQKVVLKSNHKCGA